MTFCERYMNICSYQEEHIIKIRILHWVKKKHVFLSRELHQDLWCFSSLLLPCYELSRIWWKLYARICCTHVQWSWWLSSQNKSRNLQFSTASVWCAFGGLGVCRNIVMSETRSLLATLRYIMFNSFRGSLARTSFCAYPNSVFKQLHYAHAL